MKKLRIVMGLALTVFLFVSPVMAVDLRPQWDEEAVGANHPTLADVINRAYNVEHDVDGTHKTDAIAEKTAGAGVTIDGLKIKDAGIELGSDADGDMYVRSSGALVRLPKGAANQKLFMNAAGTLPEWGSGTFVGTFTRAMDAAGAPTNVSYTGVGFKPSLVLFFGAVHGGAANTLTTYSSFATASTSGALGAQITSQWISAGYVLYFLESAGKQQHAAFVSMDADGFTLSWTKTGAPTAATVTIIYVAFR